MKCQAFFSGKNKKNIKMMSAGFFIQHAKRFNIQSWLNPYPAE